MLHRIIAFLVGTVPLSLLAAEVKFATPPKVMREAGETIVTFAISEPTDVEVAVFDAKGESFAISQQVCCAARTRLPRRSSRV